MQSPQQQRMATFSFNKPQSQQNQQLQQIQQQINLQFQSPIVGLPLGGKNVLDIDIDTLEEKAWRKPGSVEEVFHDLLKLFIFQQERILPITLIMDSMKKLGKVIVENKCNCD